MAFEAEPARAITADGLGEVFGPAGPLARCVADFAPRPEQLAMAQAVADAISRRADLVVEAGTGTGKTLAYLVPVLQAGQRAVISTGTRTLQDQLYHRDLPMLAQALGRPARVRMLKGRRNYLCRYRLNRVDTDSAASVAMSRELGEIRAWAQHTGSGDIAELSSIPDVSAVWNAVTSTAENCLGTQCPDFAECHVAKARQAAREADIVVVNHHLLMADLTMKEEGFGQLLPGAEFVVVDEAHRFPDVAQGFFNVSVSAAQIDELLGDLAAEIRAGDTRNVVLEQELDELADALAQARRALPAGTESLGWEQAGQRFSDLLSGQAETLSGLADELEPLTEQSAGIRRCRERCQSIADRVIRIAEADHEEALRWVRPTNRGFVANLTPLDVSPQIEALLDASDCTWVFTSATLAVGHDFGHFTSRLGTREWETRQIPSPFDYGRIARLYLPMSLPEPAAPQYTAHVVDSVLPVLQASRGRAFLLFTSHRALREAAELLRARADFDFPLLVQGEAPRSWLLEEFARSSSPVLLGTATFWEGVDIRGHGLVLVMIDRLPFASPGDPMLAARLEAIRNHGGNPFREYQLPQAVLALKQGVGRLIRDYNDYGVVMVCDPRLSAKSYGRLFLESLPPMPVTRELDDVCRFYAQHQSHQP